MSLRLFLNPAYSYFKSYKIIILALLLCMALVGKVFGQTTSKPAVPAPQTFGAWTKVCSIPPGTPNIQCELVQTVRGQDRPDIVFRITLYKLPNNQGTLMRAFVPIRIELPPGVGVKIDNKDIGKMLYRRCLGENCVAESLLTDEALQPFLDGKSATFFVFPTPEQGVGGMVDLTGLTQAYRSL